MAIRIQRNANGNAINFIGTSMPTYWNACLSGEVNTDDPNKVNVVNDIQTTDTNEPVYEFFAIPYTDFTDEDGNGFANAQAAADYITEKANVVAGGTLEFTATDSLDAARDATNTNILFSTGNSYGVNAIRAVAQADGNITIEENVVDGTALFTDVRPANVTIGGDVPTSVTTNAVVNALNALFTVTPIGLGDVDPQASITTIQSTLAASEFTTFGDVTLSGSTFTKGSNTGSQVNDGMYSDDIINEAGDYFEFDVASSQGNNDLYGGAFVMGFKNGANPVSEITGNTANMGNLDLALRFRGMNSAEEHDYGVVIEPGFYNNPKSRNKFRMGLDADRRLYISFYESDINEWQIAIRSAFPTVDEEYRAVFFLKRENAFLPINAVKHTVTADVPVLYHRYIESPDGDFHYPLFATQEEAEHKDTLNGGSGQSAQYSFTDENPSVNIWYGPATGYSGFQTAAPVDPNIVYTAIPTFADSGFTPAAFTFNDVTVDEGSTVNINLAIPADSSFTQTVSGLPTGLTYNSTTNRVEGTAPEVTGVIADNPSDVFTITVTRTNTFGSTTSTFDITVNNLTNTITAISGFTAIAASATMVDADTLADGSAVEITDATNDGSRTILNAAWVNSYIWPVLQANPSAKIFVGFPVSSPNYASIDTPVIATGWQFENSGSTPGQLNKYVRPVTNGSVTSNVNFGTGAWTLGLVCINDSTNGKLYANYLGSSLSGTYMPTSGGYTASAGDYKVIVAVTGAQMDISTTGISETANPVTTTSSTTWAKAIDFSGGNEHMQLYSTSTGVNVLSTVNGNTVAEHSSGSGYTSNASFANPWATTCVFKVDGNSSNQHIWNFGEGAGSNDDNIYLRLDASRNLYFGWGRQGALNEVIVQNTLNTSRWYGVYIAHNGTRLSGSNATGTNLAAAFDIRVMSSADSFGSLSSNGSVPFMWNNGQTGARMDRAITGRMYLGGRGSNRNFHGKIASFVNTTLPTGVAMPTAAEIEKMIADPIGWLNDYKIGSSHRPPNQVANNSNFQLNGYGADWGCGVYLMGDGTGDGYPYAKNQVNTQSTSTQLVMQGMVSNDIENVTIPGL